MYVLHGITPGALLGNFIIVTGAFLTLIVLVRVFAWKAITRIFEERANRIARDLEEAERAREKAESYVAEQEELLKKSRLEASQIVGKANARAAHDKEAILAQAREEAQAIKDMARQQAEQLKAEAIESAKKEVSLLAIDLAEKILLKELTPEVQSGLVDRYLEQLGGK